MNLTNNSRSLILNALRTRGITKTQLAETMGYGNAWVTKLLNGTLKTLSDDDTDRIEDFLGIQFFKIVEREKKVPALAWELAKIAEQNPQFAKVLESLLPLLQEAKLTPRYFSTKEMSRLGNEIIRLCYANEDKPGKVAREVLRLVTDGD